MAEANGELESRPVAPPPTQSIHPLAHDPTIAGINPGLTPDSARAPERAVGAGDSMRKGLAFQGLGRGRCERRRVHFPSSGPIGRTIQTYGLKPNCGQRFPGSGERLREAGDHA
jgi:hypothetical protein